MSFGQRIIMTIGLLGLAVAVAFPPWIAIPEFRSYGVIDAGYRFIGTPPHVDPIEYQVDITGQTSEGGKDKLLIPFHMRVDFRRLLVEWIVMAALIGVVFVAPGRPPVSEGL